MDRNLEQARAYLSHSRTEDDAAKKLEQLKEKLKIFEGITSIAQARKLAKENFYIENDVNYINLENAMCVIVQSANDFKVCLEDEKEVILYSITKPKEKKKHDDKD